MKHLLLTLPLLALMTLVACAAPQKAPTVPTAAPSISGATLTSMPAPRTSEEVEVTALVERFGKKLQAVSLLAPDAPQEIHDQYSEFVDPTLLETWINNVPKAPGRMVSSPWPDRIEISSVSREGPDRYTITGFVIEITSTEIGSNQAAVRISVNLVVERREGRWIITQYAEER